jgi:hypothetical protein
LDIKEFTFSSDESEYLRMKTDPLPKYFCWNIIVTGHCQYHFVPKNPNI